MHFRALAQRIQWRYAGSMSALGQKQTCAAQKGGAQADVR